MIPKSGNRFSDEIMPKPAASRPDAPHLPRSAPIEAYGNGGFAFAEMSHRGSLLCLPDAIWAWPVTTGERYRRGLAGPRLRSRQCHRHPDCRHRHGCLGAAQRSSRGAARRRHRARPDADRTCDPHLQHHDRRAAARRGGADRGSMSDPAEAREAASFCADLVRAHDFARYASTLFVPAAQRRALLALYAFNVEISRVHEQVSQPLPGEMRLQWWTDMLAGLDHGGVEGNPVAAELLLAIRNWRLPVERLSRLIEEHQFDLYNDPMPTMAALEGYINDTSSALFSLARGDRRTAVGGDRASRAPCRARPGHGAGDGLVAAGCVAASVVCAAAGAGAARLRNRGGIRRQGNPEIARRAGSAARRGAGASEHRLCAACGRRRREVRPVFLPLALVRRDLARMSRADNDPFVPRSTSQVADAVDVVAGLAVAGFLSLRANSDPPSRN